MAGTSSRPVARAESARARSWLQGGLGEAWSSVAESVAEAVRALSGYSLLTVVGLVLGFLREITVASTFGLNPELDVFVAITSLYLFFGAQLGNALESALIARVGNVESAGVLFSVLRPALAGLLAVQAGVLACLWFGAGPLVGLLFPRFEGAQQELAVHTLRALLPPIVFASAAGLLRGALAGLGSFAPGFLAGSIISLCSIASVLGLSSRLGIDALTLGVAAGNLVVLAMFAWQLARRRPLEPGGPMPVKSRGWFLLWRAAAVVLMGELVYAGVAVTERSLASSLSPGSVAAFFYAGTIVSVPLSLVAVPLATVAFPSMVEKFSSDRASGMALLYRQGLLLLAANVGVVVLVAVLAQPIVELIFVRGRFSPEDARVTASILTVTVFALPFMSLSRLVRNACYALSNFRAPLQGLCTQWAVLIGLGSLLASRYGAQGVAVAMVAAEASNVTSMGLALARTVRRPNA